MAENLGRKARDLMLEHGPIVGAGVAGDTSAASAWKLENGSRYYAVGAGGALTGRRADLALIDDPVKDAIEAGSENARDKLWDWYQSVLLTRLKPNGRVVLIMTRWHPDDLAGRLLDAEPDEWRVLRLAALAEADDPLGREEGEPLWADGNYGYGTGLVAKRDGFAKAGALRFWSALYQQRPVPGEGVLFQVDRIAAVDAIPAGARRVRAWDLAATKKIGSRDPDWTSGVLLASTERPVDCGGCCSAAWRSGGC